MKEVLQAVAEGQVAWSEGWFNLAQTEIHCTGTASGGRAKGRLTRRLLGRGLACVTQARGIHNNYEFILRGTLREAAVRDLALMGRIYNRAARRSSLSPQPNHQAVGICAGRRSGSFFPRR
jgi:hypothetical protein